MRVWVALAIMIATVWHATGFPVDNLLVLAALPLFAWAQYRWHNTWLFITPVLLAGVDLSPWSGRLFIQIPDYFLAVAVAMWLIRGERPQHPARLTRLAGAGIRLLVVGLAIGTLVGLYPYHLPSVNSFADYLDPYNAVRVLKGYLWALVLLPMLLDALGSSHAASRAFLRGMTAATAIVALYGVRERWLYSGLLNFNSDLRVISTFGSMHVGGGHIGYFLVLALPCVLATALRDRSVPVRIGATAVLMVGLYTLLVTFARGAWAASAVSMIVAGLLLLVYRGHGRRWLHRAVGTLQILLVACFGGYLILLASQGQFTRQRLSTISHDARYRAELVETGLKLVHGWEYLFGAGLGSYPRRYYSEIETIGSAARRLILYDGDNPFMRSIGGNPAAFYDERLFLVGQRVEIRPGRTYRLSFLARSPTATNLEFELHEKPVQYSSGGIALRRLPPFTPDWKRYELVFSSGKIGAGPPLLRPSVMLFFRNFNAGGIADIDDVHLTDESGRELLCNGDFSRGHDCWSFESKHHTAYQLKNAYTGLHFDLGVPGVAGIALLMLGALRSAGRGAREAPASAAALTGGLLGSLVLFLVTNPLTAPRLITLFLLVILMRNIVVDRNGTAPDGNESSTAA